MASTKLIYFAWVRERIGVPDEEIALPAEIATVKDLLGFLKSARRRLRGGAALSRGDPRGDRPGACRARHADRRRP